MDGSDSETEEAVWQTTTEGDGERRRSADAIADVQKGAITGALLGVALLVAGVSQLTEAGPRLPVLWTLLMGGAALTISATKQTRAGFAQLGLLALLELSIRLFDLRDALASDDALSLLLAASVLGVLPVVLYIFVEAYRGTADHQRPELVTGVPLAPLLLPAIVNLFGIGLFGLMMGTGLTYFAKDILRGFQQPGARVTSKQDWTTDIARNLNNVKKLGVKPFQEEGKPHVLSGNEAARIVGKSGANGSAADVADSARVTGTPQRVTKIGTANVPAAVPAAVPATPEAPSSFTANAITEDPTLGPANQSGADAALITMYRKEAEQGSAAAQNNLGSAYFFGHGVPQDYVQAHLWWNLAAARGNPEAINSRDAVAAKMTSRQIAQAQKMARKWKPTKE